MLVIAAILAVFVYGMIAAMLGTILPDFSQRFRLSPRQSGKIALVQALGLIAASVFTGPLIDSHGTKAGLLVPRSPGRPISPPAGLRKPPPLRCPAGSPGGILCRSLP
jgi:MFS family permease